MSLNFGKTIRILLVLLMMPWVTGCWDRLEIEQRAAILGVALDVVGQGTPSNQEEQNQPQSEANQSKSPSAADKEQLQNGSTLSDEVSDPTLHLVEISAQIAVPGRIPLGPGESGGGGGDSPKKTIWIVRARGKTLHDAMMELQQKLSNEIFFGHLRAVVVSEEYAREYGLRSLVDVIRRDPEVRRTAWLLVAKDKASSFMEVAPPLERVPALYLISTLDHAQRMGKLTNDFVGVFASRLTMLGREPVLPYLEVQNNDTIKIDGLSFFKGDKMVDFTKKPVDAASYLELVGSPSGGYTVMVKVPGHEGTVMWESYRRTRKIRVTLDHGIPQFNVNITLDGNIREKSTETLPLTDPRFISELNGTIDKAAEEHALALIAQTQRTGADVVGFGEYVRAKTPRYWDKYIQTKQRWEKIYPKIKVQIHVYVRTHRIGMQSK